MTPTFDPTRFKGVILVGGPLEGSIVAKGAPALHPDWWRSWPCWQGFDFPKVGLRQPGRYVLDPTAELATAVWQSIDARPPMIRRGLLAGVRGLGRRVLPFALAALAIVLLLAALSSGIAYALTIGDVFLRLLADDKDFGADVERKAGAVADKAGARAGRTLGQRMSQGASRALTVGGAAIGTFVASGIELFVGFQQRMNEVFTLLPGITDQAMGKMTDDVKAFARETGVLPDDVIPALYQAISAGVPPDNVFDFLRVANKNAVGGVTDLATSVDGISSVVNAYGADVLSAAEASDIMFTGVRLGKTTIGDLSKSLFQVIPTAAALGVGFGDVTAALAAMTAQGVPTSVATTQLRQLFVELSKEGTKTSKTFEEIAGKSFKQFVAEGGNVQEALQLLEKHAGSSGKGINDLFGSVEAGSAALALTGKGAETLTNNLEQMGTSAGATDKAFEQMDSGIAASGRKIAATVATIAIDVGEKFQSIGPLLLALNQGGQLFGISPARLFGGVAGAVTGKVIPGIIRGFAGIAAKILPSAIAAGTTSGAAMGTAAAAAEVTAQTTGVVAGQAAVGAAAAPAAAAQGTLIGRAMGLAAAAAVAAIPITIAVTAAVLGDQFLEDLKKQIDENVTDAIAGGDAAVLADLEKELQGRIRSARASHVNEPVLRDLERQLARVQAARLGEVFGPPRPTQTGGLSPTDRDALAKEWTSGWTRGVDRLHEDLVKAMEVIRTSNDPKAVGDAIAAVLKSVLGGEGNAAQTRALVAELSAKRDAALARGDTATAQAFANAIARIEPLAKGRQWQKEQLDKAQKIVDSNKTTADKVAALQSIERDLLSHQRTMAASIVEKLREQIAATKALPTGLAAKIRGMRINVGRGPTERDPGPSGPKGGPTSPTVNDSTGFVIKGRAAGGPVRAGQPYWVGERGVRELFVPRVSGQVVPLAMAQPSSDAGGNTYQVNVQGLLKARDAFEVTTQLKRLGDFGVLTPSAEPK